MSWAEEDWTVGLSGRVLQKVKELQVLKDRLSRESKQKQLQLDNIHISLNKQTVKYEEVRGELQSVRRELQMVQGEAKAAVTSVERLTQELQTKQAQVCSLEGQLDASRTLNNKLTQEVKRLEAELEKLQNSSRLADTTLFSTPCWNAPSPWEHNGSRKEERGNRDEGQSRVLHSRQRLQFSDGATASLPRQQHKNTPHRHPSERSDTFSTPLAAFPWEREDSRPAARRQSPPSPQMPYADVTGQVQSQQRVSEKDCRIENDSSALLGRVSALEGELRMKAETLKSIQSEMVQSKKDLAAKELSVQRTQKELSLAQACVAKESERASGAEQKLKQLQEELRCQRQNAESSRLQHQQRAKEQEKQHQRDLAELQKERQALEKQHQQEVNKLNQELQQARTLHNALQAQADKLSLQKQALDKELDCLKEKLKWTEGQLQESQKKEAQTQAKLTEAVREAERVAVCLEQSRKKESALEEEGRTLAEERADALRLVKELQEQQVAPAALVHHVPFGSIGQSFSPQTSYSLNSRLSTHITTTAATRSDEKREGNVDKRRDEITASYPSEREPGEGIDSEQIALISPNSEGLQREGRRRKINEAENQSKNEAIDSDTSGTSEHSTFDHVLSTSSHSAADTPKDTSIDCGRGNVMLSADKALSLKSEQVKTSEDVRRENDALRSELRDAREELQKRLDDLEAQRRAEAEARTRLKQLSRKHASQSVERDEQDREWRAQLEKEKAETERLRKAMAALEAEMKRGREAREKNERREQEEEKTKVLEDRETEMIELNILLKKQLAEVKAQLALEREERHREEEERERITNTDIDVKKELNMKLQKLEAELEVLKGSRKSSPEEESVSVACSPLTHLTLHDKVLNSNMVSPDNSLLTRPEQYLLLCESTNQRNMLVSQATADLIQEEGAVIVAEHSSQMASDHGDTRQDYLVGSSLSEKLQKDEPTPSDTEKAVKRLQKENIKETERANQYQVKLEALQNQVTLQTQHLTRAFDKQSQHISGLLAELQQKESALLRQGEELQRYKQEVETLKDQTEKDERKRRDEMTVKGVEDREQKEKVQKESLGEISGLQPNREKECATMFLDSNSLTDSSAQRDASQPERVTSASERSTHIFDSESFCPGEQHPDSVDSDKTPSHHDIEETVCSQDRETADVVAELQALQQENQLLKQRILGLTNSNTSDPVSHTGHERPEDAVKQSENTGNVNLPCSAEPRSASAPHAMRTEVQQSPLHNVKKSEGEDLERRCSSTEEELEAEGQLQVNRLQQQVVELHTRIQALSEENNQQAMELAVWRIISKPAPTFDLPNTDNQSECLNQSSAVRQSQSKRKPYLGVRESSGNVTIIRGDEVLLSCSSSKLQGHMLFSRLQHSNLPESKSLNSSKKTAELEENNPDPARIDKDSEKENQELNISHLSKSCQSQRKEKRDSEVIQMSSEKKSHQHVSNASHTIPGAKQTKCRVGNPEAKSDVYRQTSEINTTIDSSDTDVRTETKSVSSQTDKSLYPGSTSKEPVPLSVHCASTQTELEEDAEKRVESSLPPSEEAEAVDTLLFSGSFPIPADPASLAERIRRNRTQLSAAFDETEYEPYGLPEVVMKGFADIPSGPSCPYIVRRGLLGTAVVPVPQTNHEEETD